VDEDYEESEAHECEVTKTCRNEAVGIVDGTLYCAEHRELAHETPDHDDDGFYSRDELRDAYFRAAKGGLSG